jgi:hypothetical protein
MRKPEVSAKAILSGAILAVAATISAASAQTYVGRVAVEGPVYQRAVPISPDAIFNALEHAGYREFGAMAPREPVYKLSAVNPRGDLVTLTISMFTGEIEDEAILRPNYRRPLRVHRAVPPIAPEASAAPQRPAGLAPPPRGSVSRDPLVVY